MKKGVRHMNIQRFFCILLILVTLVSATGCNERTPQETNESAPQETNEGVHHKTFDKGQMLALFDEHRDYFTELVNSIKGDTNFLENGNVEPDGTVFVCSKKDRHFPLFNERSQKAVLKFIEYGAYMVYYNFGKGVISVTFIGNSGLEAIGFDYLMDQSDPDKVESYCMGLASTVAVERLSDGWIMTISLA